MWEHVSFAGWILMIKDLFKDELFLREVLINCYRKFKSFAFYANGIDYLKQKIALFEQNSVSMNNRFDRLSHALFCEDGIFFSTLYQELDFYVFPKTVTSANGKSHIITNDLDAKTIEIKKVNFFINASIETYILDTLWTLCYGRIIVEDEQNYSLHSAYQFDNSLFNVMETDFIKSINFKSLSIYSHYFRNYITWKNDAIDAVEKLYNANSSCGIFSLDLSSYYYSVVLDQNQLINPLKVNHDEILDSYSQLSFLQDFVFNVYKKYSNTLSKYRYCIGKSTIIPIGLVSSGTVANVYLLDFDLRASKIEGIKYYARYVDDILFVTEKRIEDYGNSCKDTITHEFPELFLETQNDYIAISKYPNLKIQNEKIKVISIFSEGSKSIIDMLKEEIGKASEPHLMPNISFGIDDFLKAIYVKKSDSFKIRDTEALDINPKNMMSFFASYLLSKKNSFLSDNPFVDSTNKYESHDEAIIDQIQKAFTNLNLISLFSRWSKVFSFALLAEQDTDLSSALYNKIRNGIKNLSETFEKDTIVTSKKSAVLKRLKKTLVECMEIDIGLALSVRLNPKFKYRLPKKSIDLAPLFRNSNLLDNKLVAFPLYNYFVVNQQIPDLYNMSFEIAKASISKPFLDKEKVRYSPRFINLDEYSVAYNLLNVEKTNKRDYPEKLYSEYHIILQSFGNDFYEHFNLEFHKKVHKNYPRAIIEMESTPDGDKPNELFIALANMNLSRHNMIPHGLINWKQCTIERKRELYRILNEAYFPKFEQKVRIKYPDRYHREVDVTFEQEEAWAPVHFLLFPEVSIPYEWLSDVAAFSKRSGIAIVCGIKYVKFGKRIINSVATVLPSKTDDGHRYSIVFLREKNDYSPDEKSLVKNNGLICIDSGQSFNYVFRWRNINFSVFNCYELTDILARATMKSKLDLLIATEYNKDVDYFSNIIESVSRDLYCFVAQVNSSQFGDTRIVAPMHSYNKLVASISGGERDSVHIGKINLSEFSEFQENEFSAEYLDYKKAKERIFKKFDTSHKKYSNFNIYSTTSARTQKTANQRKQTPLF
jgi:hypothetical protein